MSSHLAKEFRVQLIATMDSVLRTAVLDVLKLFESSLHEHEKELAQKGEKIVQLEGKLEEAEAKLKGFESRDDTGAEITQTNINASQKEPEQVVVSHGQPSDDEADRDVPDDWCAPLGTEANRNDDVCPSVRLRMLSIQLNNISKVQHIEVNGQKKAVKRSKTGISLKMENNHTQNKSTQMFGTASLCPPVANDIKPVLIELEQGKNISTGKRQEDPMMSKTEVEKNAATVSKFTEQKPEKYEEEESEEDESKEYESEEEEDYSCTYCGKKFRTLFGQNVHERCHMSCRGCLTVFPSLDAVRSHEPHCPRLQKLLAKKSQAAASSTPQSNEKPVNTAISEEDTCNPPVENTEDNCEVLTSTRQDTNQTVKIKDDTCTPPVENAEDICEDLTSTRQDTNQTVHIEEHTCTPPVEMTEDNCEDLTSTIQNTNQRMKSEEDTWTPSVEMTEDNCEDLIATIQDTNQTVKSEEDTWTPPVEIIEDKSHEPHCTKPKKCLAKTTNKNTLGSDSSSKPSAQKTTRNFPCFFCNRIFSVRSKWEDHIRVHTGEKPFSCNLCPKRFRTEKVLNRHQVKKHQGQVTGLRGIIQETGTVEMTEANCEDLPSTSQQTTRTVRRKNVVRPFLPVTVSNNALRHWRTLTRECSDGFICVLCGYRGSRNTVVAHLRTHRKKRTYKCVKCSTSFRYVSQITAHKKNCRPLPTIRCDKCRKRYLSQLAFDKHVCHSKDYRYFCGVCGASFKSNGSYRSHMEIHKFEGFDVGNYM